MRMFVGMLLGWLVGAMCVVAALAVLPRVLASGWAAVIAIGFSGACMGVGMYLGGRMRS